MAGKTIPDIVVSRLPVYLQTLKNSEKKVKPPLHRKNWANIACITAAQVRKDLSFLW